MDFYSPAWRGRVGGPALPWPPAELGPGSAPAPGPPLPPDQPDIVETSSFNTGAAEQLQIKGLGHFKRRTYIHLALGNSGDSDAVSCVPVSGDSAGLSELLVTKCIAH